MINNNILIFIKRCEKMFNKFQHDKKVKKDLNSEELLRVIFEYVSKVATERDYDKILVHMADMGRELVVADRCTLWLLDREKNELWAKVAHGVDEIRMSADIGFVGSCVKTGQHIFIEDASKDPRHNKDVDRKTGYTTKSVLVIPIANNEGEIIGAFQAINKLTKGGKFTQIDIDHLILTASYSANSLEAAILNKEIEATQREVVFLMGEIGESRSKETGNHVKRVAEYSKIIALKCGLSEDEAECLKTASPMHDIGKVAIPDEVLKKPGKLTDEEFEQIKKHSEIGYNILKNSKRKILRAAAIVSYQHHEKWNGKGYPNNLKGEDIHIYARITAIADVFDALGSDRCYKKAWELDRILTLFKEERGQHFCPLVTDAFFDSLNQILEIRDAFKD
jgi:HD-GYP domain-containing protein (c-di-GMP phosphodiesterase class II)